MVPRNLPCVTSLTFLFEPFEFQVTRSRYLDLASKIPLNSNAMIDSVQLIVDTVSVDIATLLLFVITSSIIQTFSMTLGIQTVKEYSLTRDE